MVMNNTDTRSVVAAEVRASLARKGESAAWLAETTAISKAALSRKLRGDTSFTVEEIVSIALALDADPAKLLPAAEVAA